MQTDVFTAGLSSFPWPVCNDVAAIGHGLTSTTKRRDFRLARNRLYPRARLRQIYRKNAPTAGLPDETREGVLTHRGPEENKSPDRCVQDIFAKVLLSFVVSVATRTILFRSSVTSVGTLRCPFCVVRKCIEQYILNSRLQTTANRTRVRHRFVYITRYYCRAIVIIS